MKTETPARRRAMTPLKKAKALPVWRVRIAVKRAMALLMWRATIPLKRVAAPLTRARRRVQPTPALAQQERLQRKFLPRGQGLAVG
ncbi:MAG: hypothetical protein DME71_03245 [Verrucomicrobia bacterium]|nr:MAG: hypothetical protein DME71_03245 [Verrucomicrobiota bacterium]